MKSADNIFANAVAKLRINDFTAAEKLLAKVARLHPGHIPTLLNLAIAQQAQGKLRDAELTLQEATRIGPNNVDAQLLLSRLLLTPDRFQDALKIYEKILHTHPFILEVHCNKAAVLNEIGRHEDAVASARAALDIDPKHVESLLNLGNALFNLAKYGEAYLAHRRALDVEPNNKGNLLGLGNALVELNRRDEAMAIYDRLLETDPADDGALIGRANLHFDSKQYQDALVDYDKLLLLRPHSAKAWLGRGNVFYNLKRYEEAFADYDKAFGLDANLQGVESARLYTKMHLADWRDIESDWSRIIQSVRSNKAGIIPFSFLAVPSTSEDQLKCAQLWTAKKYPRVSAPFWRGEIYRHDKIRVGYLSADFHQHATSYLMAGLFECHTRSKFEVIGLSYGPNDQSLLRARLIKGFDRFIDLGGLSDDEVASEIRKLEIDILVDLKGFTQDARTGIVCRRPSPIQVSYLGYPGTMGAEYIDYVFADRIVIPEDQRELFLEKIVYLPNSYQINDSKRIIAEKEFTRSGLGLPQKDFVFCCFNSTYKITPGIFDCWMRILNQTDGSVLWLLGDSASAANNLKDQAVGRGVKADRLVFAPRVSPPDHLARHRLADLFLDTLPYNAHTTASDALWAGLPVLTCLGETFAGRVAGSLLNAIKLPELISTSLEGYERMAMELAAQPEKLAAIKRKVADHRLTTPLFDTQTFTRHIEAAYTAIHERLHTGLPPDHIVIMN